MQIVVESSLSNIKGERTRDVERRGDCSGAEYEAMKKKEDERVIAHKFEEEKNTLLGVIKGRHQTRRSRRKCEPDPQPIKRHPGHSVRQSGQAKGGPLLAFSAGDSASHQEPAIFVEKSTYF